MLSVRVTRTLSRTDRQMRVQKNTKLRDGNRSVSPTVDSKGLAMYEHQGFHILGNLDAHRARSKGISVSLCCRFEVSVSLFYSDLLGRSLEWTRNGRE